MNNRDLDNLDLQILRLLQKNARLTNKELAATLHRSSSNMFDRVERLKELGYIKGIFTIINHEKIDSIFISFTQVQINQHSNEALLAFQEEVIQFPEVLECYHTTGEYDFLLKIVVPSMYSYQDVIMKKISLLKNVGSLKSGIVVTEAKREFPYPIHGAI